MFSYSQFFPFFVLFTALGMWSLVNDDGKINEQIIKEDDGQFGSENY